MPTLREGALSARGLPAGAVSGAASSPATSGRARTAGGRASRWRCITSTATAVTRRPAKGSGVARAGSCEGEGGYALVSLPIDS